MNVAHVITRMIVGGAQENTLDSVRGLQALGNYQVSLFSGPELGPEGDLLGVSGGRAPSLRTVRWLRRAISPLCDALAFLELVRIFSREKFDVVHTHSSKAGILGRLAARWTGVPLIVHTVHGFAIGPYHHPLRNFLYRALERFAARRTDVMIYVTGALMAEAGRLGLRPRQSCIVPSGFDWEMFAGARQRREEIRRRLGIAEREVVIAKVARFFPLKGHEQLFRALGPLLEKYAHLKFLLVGDGILKSHFQEIVKTAGWSDRVLFTGLIPSPAVADHLAASDILAHTSLREGLARAIPQAFACRLPVVCYDIDGVADLVADGESGFLVKAFDAGGLERSLATLVEDADLRRRMGEKGSALAKEKYALGSMVRALDAIYRGIP